MMADNKKKIKPNRFLDLIIRILKDVEIFFASLIFACRYLRFNDFSDLFFFRKAIEVDQISPFRSFFKHPRHKKNIKLLLPQFGNVKIGFDLCDKFQMSICEEFVKFHIYDLDLVNFIPDISLDCGSYRGYFTFLINQYFVNCKKICIEPHPENYNALIQTVKENNIANFESYNKALSRSPQKLVLELAGSNMAVPTSKGEVRLVYVETESLLLFLNKVEFKKKMILKVDIEGSELDFFPECISILPDCTAVFLETHDGWNSLHTIKAKFKEHGFQFSVLRERGLFIDSFAIRSQLS